MTVAITPKPRGFSWHREMGVIATVTGIPEIASNPKPSS
jgi:hypothetical protein